MFIIHDSSYSKYIVIVHDVHVSVIIFIMVCSHFSAKLRGAALQSLYTLARNYDNSNWRDHVEEAVNLLLTCIEVRQDKCIMYMYV